MRISAAIGLLVAAGCNQIWGLDPTIVIDAPPPIDPDANLPRIRLTSQIAKTLADGKADPVLDYGPLDPAPAVQIGRVDGPLMAATYSPDGTVAIPQDFLGTKWRLFYEINGEPREIHWAPTGDLLGHVVEPLFGRTPRAPVPAAGGYRITPMGPGTPTQHPPGTRVFTTGIWTEGVFAVAPPAGATVDYVFDQKALSMSGPIGAPERSKGDHAVLADFQTMNGCRYASGTATFAVPDLTAGVLAPPTPQPTYRVGNQPKSLTFTAANSHGRFNVILGSRLNAAPDQVRWRYGYVPSLSVFGFSRPADQMLGGFQLPGPAMIALAECSYLAGSPVLMTPPFAEPVELRDRFPAVVHVEVIDIRTLAGGAELKSGLSAVVTSSVDLHTTDFEVAAPTTVRLTRAGNIADLSADADNVALPAGSGTIELTFDVELQVSRVSDYFEITLHKVEGSVLIRQRIYTVSERKLALDPSFLTPNTQYVFEIRAFRGRPDIVRHDFTVNSYPQIAATVFTRTFITPP